MTFQTGFLALMLSLDARPTWPTKFGAKPCLGLTTLPWHSPSKRPALSSWGDSRASTQAEDRFAARNDALAHIRQFENAPAIVLNGEALTKRRDGHKRSRQRVFILCCELSRTCALTVAK